MTTYSQKHYSHIIDERTEKQRQQQHVEVERIVQNNFKSLKIELTPKRTVRYEPRQRQKVDLGKGWYCYITDSDGSNATSNEKKRNTVLTLHGSPGDHVEWAGLETQMGPQYRWVNLTFPGFDGEDERRGDYDSTYEHFSQMIVRLLQHLKIPKVVLCTHSMGSIFSSYFITHYPAFVQGYVNITGIVDHWYVGLLTFVQVCITKYGYNSQEWRDKRLFDDDNCRAIMHNLFLREIDGKFFGPVEFPRLTKTQYMAYMKLFNSTPNGISQLYHQNKSMQLLRVLLFGKKDPLHLWTLTEASIYNLCRGPNSYIRQPKYIKLFESAKGSIEKKLKEVYDIQIDASKLQDYFCYHLPDTGHNVHKRRPKEISKILKVYITCLQILEEHAETNNSKL